MTYLVCFFYKYVSDEKFERHGLRPVELLFQALSGLAHLHSLNIGNLISFYRFVFNISPVTVLLFSRNLGTYADIL